MQAQTPTLVYKLSLQLGYAPNKEKLAKSLLSHPDYPGFASITDSLTEHSISCAAMHVSEQHLFQLTEAFLTILKRDTAEQLVLVVPEANQFTIHDGQHGPYTCTAAEFLAVWSGNIIAVEKNAPPVSRPLITTPLLWQLLTASLLFALFGFSPNGTCSST